MARGGVLIFKARNGTGVSGAMRYVRGPGKDENGQAKTERRDITLGGQGFGFEVTDENLDLARKMMEHNGSREMQGHKNKYCENDAFHMSLSWARGQNPSREEQIEAAREFMKAVGMKDAMATYHAHIDKSFAHVHVIGSRIDPTDPQARAFDDYQLRYKGIRRAIEWEREKGQITKETQHAHDWAQAVERQDYDRLRDLLFKNEATLPKSKLDLSLAMGGKLGAELDAMREDFVQRQELIRLQRYQGGRVSAYTQAQIWQEEARALAAARRLKEMEGHLVPQETLEKYAEQLTLNEEQREAFWHSTRDNGLSMITGEAGTGKTRTLKAIRDAYKEQGYDVRGLAFTNKVTQSLQREGFDAATIASELARLRNKNPHWNDKTAAIIDEAAQLSTKDMAELIQQAAKHRAKLIMAGDHRQLGSVDKGGLWEVMEKRFGSARLSEVQRNKDPAQKRAWHQMHERKFEEAVDIFREAGSIKWSDTKEQAVEALTRKYMADFLEDPEAKRLIMAGTNDDVDHLNEWARNLHREHGRLGPDVELPTSKGPKRFSIGDRLQMTETPNKKDKPRGLINGAFGEITDLRETKDGKREITFRLDRKPGEQERSFKFKVGAEKGDVQGINHGYASTVYKAQGDTLDRTYVQHNPQSTAPTNYVQLSRHADKVEIHVPRETTSGYRDLAEQLKHGRDKTAAHSYRVHEDDRAKLNRPITPRMNEQERAPEPQQSMETPERSPIEERLQGAFGHLQELASKAKQVIEQAMELGR